MSDGFHAALKAVESPCIQVCDIGDDGLCLGCFRTLEEISIWGAMGNAWRSCVVSRLDRRRALARDRTRV